jgi:hypothetical protein
MAITDEQQLQAALAEIDSLTAALERMTEDWENAVRARDDWAERAEKAEAVVEAARFALPVLQEYSIDADEVGAQTAASQMHEAHEVLYAALAALDEPPTEQT